MYMHYRLLCIHVHVLYNIITQLSRYYVKLCPANITWMFFTVGEETETDDEGLWRLSKELGKRSAWRQN